MPERTLLPLSFLPNMLPVLDGVYVHAYAPVAKPVLPGPYRALIDTGSSHSWVKPAIGDNLRSHSLEGYVVDRGNNEEEEVLVDVKTGFLKGLSGNPRKGWIQLEPNLPAIDLLLLSGDFEAPVDLVLGMDLMLSFVQCAVLVRGLQFKPTLVIEY